MSQHIWKTTLKKSWVYPKLILVFWLTWNQKKKKKKNAHTHASPFERAERASDIYFVYFVITIRTLSKIIRVNVVISVWARLARGCLMHKPYLTAGAQIPIDRGRGISKFAFPNDYYYSVQRNAGTGLRLPAAAIRADIGIYIGTRYCFCGR